MPAQTDRLDLRLEASDKREFALAAQLLATPVSSFVRQAARERAREVIAQAQSASTVALSAEESQRFLDALDAPFAANAKLERALARARQIPR